ncbi:hypothetical protein DL96DRAFT_1630918 [Flagelloscypha sp. PMI_526]|nr:hypothetical protein DL96DRAFT_1630918 [Flagelloscypha sp. PMI_526]
MTMPPGLPSYSGFPAASERRLEYQPTSAQFIESQTTKSYKRLSKSLSLILDSQRDIIDGVDTPLYTSSSRSITGILSLDSQDVKVQGFSATLSGRLELMLTGVGATARTLFSETTSIWSAGNGAQPSTIPVTLAFPPGYEDQGGARSLPSSLETPSSSITYQLTIFMSYIEWGFQKKTRIYTIPLLYRNVPRRPREEPFLLEFISTVKTHPEEWRQRSATLPDEIGIEFFSPTHHISSASSFPFHLQLTGIDDASSNIQHFHPPSYGSTAPTPSKQLITVQLVRCITVTVHGHTKSKDLLLADANLVAVETDLPSRVLQWKGQLDLRSCGVGNTNTGNLQMKHFVLVSTNRVPFRGGKISEEVLRIAI